MKKIITGFILTFLLMGYGHAQNSMQIQTKRSKVPRYDPWDGEVLIDNQTTLDVPPKTFEVYIEHRFGMVNAQGIHDLYGLYAPGANIRLAVSYVPVRHLVLGYGITRFNMYSDFWGKYVLFQQTRSNRMPVGIAVFGDFALDGRPNSSFGDHYRFENRFAYFGQVLVSRRFSHFLSLELTGSFTHYNTVPAGMNPDVMGFGVAGQIEFTRESSVIFQYDVPVEIRKVSGGSAIASVTRSKPNFGIGYQIETADAGHTFQIYLTTAQGIIPQEIYMKNTNDWTKGDLMLGFTITRMWNF